MGGAKYRQVPAHSGLRKGTTHGSGTTDTPGMGVTGDSTSVRAPGIDSGEQVKCHEEQHTAWHAMT